jgi:hypothetical protein
MGSAPPLADQKKKNTSVVKPKSFDCTVIKKHKDGNGQKTATPHK